MKKMFVIVLSILPLFAGCGSETATGVILGAGAVAGGNEIVKGTRAELDKKEVALLARRAEVLERMEASTDQLEIAQLQAENESLLKKLSDVQTGRTAVDIGDQALNTNWTDPEAITGFAGAAVAAALAEYFRRKNKTTAVKYDAMKSGVNEYLAATPPEQSKVLYDTIGEARKDAGIQS